MEKEERNCEKNTRRKKGKDGWKEAEHQTQAGGEKGALGVTLEGVEKRGNQC